MRNSILLCLLGLLLIGSATAGKYRQPAYITNIYFCNNPERGQSFVQPDRIFNKLKANDPEVVAHIVLNMVADKGEHLVDVDIIDSNGRVFDKLKFAPVVADRDGWTYTATGRFGGSLPAGGIFFKVYDSLDRAEKQVIGTFRLMTADW